MAPPLPLHPVATLSSAIQGNPRKPGVDVDLRTCALRELVQHKCNVDKDSGGAVMIVCEPVVRLFRECAGGMSVETTGWEGTAER